MASREETEARVVAGVIAERHRHVTEEGHTIAHDDSQDRGELARMAACYALQTDNVFTIRDCRPHPVYPANRRWAPKALYRRNLEIAAALLLAEMERVDRLADLDAGTTAQSQAPEPHAHVREGAVSDADTSTPGDSYRE